MNNEYRFISYPIETTNGTEWAVEFPDLKGCCGGGDTPEEAIADAKYNKDSYLQTLIDEGKPLPQPTDPYNYDYSGKCTVRMSKTLHKELACLAEEENVSMNQLIVEAIAERINKHSNESMKTTVALPSPLKSINSFMEQIQSAWAKSYELIKL